VVKEVIVLAFCREITENTDAPPAFEYNRRGLTRKKSKGSSLVEMMVAIFVLIMVLLSMFSMFMISRTAIYNKEDETANTIALRYIEELEGRSFDEFKDATAFNSDPANTKNFGKYNVKASVVGTPTEFIATIRVEIKWEAAVMGKKSLVLERNISASGSLNTGMQS
jgi:Tfp pilus assembly protein PilV